MHLTVIADPVDRLDPEFDTTLGLIAAARDRGHRVDVCEARDLALEGNSARARVGAEWIELDTSDVVMFRTDPPLDRRYLAATFVLDHVAPTTILVNDPRGIRLANEKLWALQFPELCPPTLVAADRASIDAFVNEHEQCVIKPVDGHAGRGVLRVGCNDPDRASKVELLTHHYTEPVVVQPWLEEVWRGNKRIFVHDGEPAAAVVRFPSGDDFRIGQPSAVAELTSRDREICALLRKPLRDLGLVLVGLDVIGPHLIEVNVTSAGALRKADRLLGTSLCADFIALLEARVLQKGH